MGLFHFNSVIQVNGPIGHTSSPIGCIQSSKILNVTGSTQKPLTIQIVCSKLLLHSDYLMLKIQMTPNDRHMDVIRFITVSTNTESEAPHLPHPSTVGIAIKT